MKKLCKSIGFIFVLTFLFTHLTVYAEQLNLGAQAYILIDSKTGQVLYEHNANQQLRPASTTKIMTAVVALEKGDLNQMMTASLDAVNDIGPGGMNIGIMAGEQIRLHDLLNALLVKSANETANIIAENICSTRQEFIDLMNKKAQELGAVNTHFVNPCGKDNLKIESEHLTTPSDLAKIARYAMTIPAFREIVNKEWFDTMPATNKHDEWPRLQTTNKLLWGNRDYPYTINGVEKKYTVNGVKTGYTDKAGNNLVCSAVNDEGMELITVLMCVKNPGPGQNVFSSTKKLLEYGFSNFTPQKLSDANQKIEAVPVAEAENNSSVDLLTQSELKAVLPSDTAKWSIVDQGQAISTDSSKWNIVKKKHINSTITAPINQGDVLGYIEYERNGVLLGKVNLIAANAVPKAIPPSITTKAISTAKQTVGNPILRNIALAFVISAISLVLLRFILRRVSRSIRAKRQHNE